MCLVGLFLSCSNESNDDFEPVYDDNLEFAEDHTCKVYIEGIKDDQVLKTYIVNNDTKYALQWIDGDRFVVSHGRSPHGTVNCKTSYRRVDGNFVKDDNNGFYKSSATHPLYAYYPASGFISNLENGKFKINLPEQIYESATKIATDMNPMFSKDISGTYTYSFKNVCALFKLNVRAKDNGLLVKSISIASHDINMSGDAIISMDENDNPLLEMPKTNGSLGTPVVMKCSGDGVPLVNGKDVPFIFVVPPYEYSSKSWIITIETNLGTTTYNVDKQFILERASSHKFTRGLNLTLSAGGTGVEGEFAD